ncbi:hypothetical protein [Pseudidiomarina aestuarii]|uniref:hypothetical protein n=1 Tax=Pseudidiomarina aestuarii TaxID=624146 RepID=UPI001474E7F6|nr:hypothetical protein [Pseudidiomarina aestuarii]
MIRKILFSTALLIAISFIGLSATILVAQHNWWQLEDFTLKRLQYIQFYMATSFIVVMTTVWLYMLAKRGFHAYKIHQLSGIIGCTIFSLSLALLIVWKSIFWMFVVAGALCLYCSFTPLINRFSRRFSNQKWEPALFWSAIVTLLVFSLGGQANILLNQHFGIDPSHFSYTKPIAVALVAAPYTLILSMVLLVISVLSLNLKKNTKSSAKVKATNLAAHTDADRELHVTQFSFFISSYVLLIISVVAGSNISTIVEKTATTLDFNNHHPCQFDSTVKGVVFLDKSLNHVLAYRPENSEKYVVLECNLVKTTSE